MSQPKRKRVILLLETHFNYGRELLDGIAEYQRMHGSWECWFRPWNQTFLPPNINNWDGVIGRFHDDTEARAVPNWMPCINVSAGGTAATKIPMVGPEDRSIGQRAALSLHERGFRKFAYVGLEQRLFANERFAGFSEKLLELGSPEPADFRYNQLLRDVESDFDTWLEHQPTPLGVFTCNDITGREVLERMLSLELKVPDQYAVIGVDNDPQVCALSFPHLSSVATNARAVGLRAAELLSAMMADKAFVPPARTLVPPLDVVHRQSSDIFAVEDSVVRKALAFVRDNLVQPIRVDDMAKAAGVSRKTLELKFAQVLQVSPACEIRNRRARKATDLLMTTRLTMSEIAEKSGIRDQSALSLLVKNYTGLAPGEFRKQHSG